MPSQPAKVPTFTVVTPSFNQLGWLRLCAASVADQQGVVVEHLVQDAGTGKDLETWAASQSKLRLFVEQDQGMYDAINRGLRRATGDVCCYLNCDEQYLPGALDQVARYFKSHPRTDVLFGDAVILDKAGQPTCYRRAVLPRFRHTRLSPLATLTCATFFRRWIVERGLLFDPMWKVIGDAVWVCELLKAGVAMAVLPRPLAAFALTGNNLSEDDKARLELDRWRSMPDAPPAWMKLPVVLHHRLRKLLAGAYSVRSLAPDLYSLDSPTFRRQSRPSEVSGRWSQTR